MSGDPVWISAIAAAVSATAAIGALMLSFSAHRAKKLADKRAQKLESENAKLRDEWYPLHQALRYLALQSSWSRSVSKTDVRSLMELLEGELLEALSRGEVRARGRRIFTNWDKLASASQPIEDKFWRYAFLQSFGEIVLHDDQRCIAVTSGEFAVTTRQQFRQIHLCKADVLQRWPRAADEQEANSVFHQALNAYRESGGLEREEAEGREREKRIFSALGRVVHDH